MNKEQLGLHEMKKNNISAAFLGKIFLSAVLLLTVVCTGVRAQSDCAPQRVPLTEGFETVTGTAWNVHGELPACWDYIFMGTDSTYAPHVSADYADEGQAVLLAAGNGGTYGISNCLLFPKIAASYQDISITFYSKMETDTAGHLSLGYWHFDGIVSYFVSLADIESSLEQTGHYYSLRDYAIPAGDRLAFAWSNNDSCAHCSIDNIRIDSLDLCLAPSITSVTVNSETSLHVEWQRGWKEQIWFVEYGPAGFTTGNGTQRLVYENSFDLTNLTPGTAYDVHVKANCTSGSSPWSEMAHGMTPCAAMNLPYYDDFESYAGTGAGVAGVLPNCWTSLSTASQGNQPHVSNWYPPMGSNGVFFSAGNTDNYATNNYAALPWFSSDLDGTKISFLSKMEFSNIGELTLGYFTNVMDANTFVALESIPSSTAVTAHEFSMEGRNIPANARLAFRWTLTLTWYSRCVIDNVAVDFLPCAPVSDLRAEDVKMTTAQIAWTPGNGETSWRVEYGADGYNHDATGTVLLVNDTTVTLTDLIGEQTYNIYVQAMCDPLNPSPYSEMLSITPYCSVLGDTAVITSCDSFVWQNNTYTQSGFYSDTLHYQAQLSCDSIIFLDLTIHHSDYEFDTLEICENELPYPWRDTTFEAGTISADFVFKRQTIHACDSIVSLFLTVHPAFYQEETETICAQELPFPWRDTTFEIGTVSGDYTFIRHTAFGCDSLVTLHLTVHPSYMQTEVVQICQSELPYPWRDTTFMEGTQSGIYTFNRESEHHCDSIVTLALIIQPSYNETIELNICRSELPYPWRDTIFQIGSVSGEYHFERQTSAGCDSLVTLTLNIGEESSEEDTLDICESELPFIWQDTIFRVGTQSGTYRFNRTGATGCANLSILHLNVHPLYHSEYSETVCENDFPLQLPDTTFTTKATSGDYTFRYASAYGCDSVVVLHLTVNPTAERYDTLHVCRNGFPQQYYDTVFHPGTPSGMYTIRRHTSAGCDSIIHLSLFVHETYGETVTLTVCEDELPMEWRGNILQRGLTSGTYTYAENSQYGCDSIVVLRLTVNPTYRLNEELTICQNELPYPWRDTTFEVGTSSGAFFFERQTASGCDSTVLLRLTVNPSKEETVSLTLCESELIGGYTWRDITFEEGTTTGDFTYERQTLNGCDSIVNLHLTINPVYEQQETYATCASSLPFVWRDTVFEVGTTSGEYIFHRHTRNGCDSVVALQLTIFPQFEQTKQYEVCQDELPLVTEDTTFAIGSLTGIYTIHYVSQNGCDSVVNISLKVNSTYQMAESEIICQNDLPYTWRDTTFQAGTQSGVYHFARTSVHGCDSMVSLALIVHPSFEEEETVEVCVNDFPFIWRDTTFQGGNTGDYHFTRHTIHGCDSLVTLHLIVHPIFAHNESIAVCQSDLPFTWRDTTFAEGSISGVYQFHRASQFGCDSVVTLYLTVNPTTTTNYTLSVCTGDLPYYWSTEDTTFEEGSISGTYFFHHSNAQGCDSNVVLNLIVNPQYAYSDEVTICANELPYYYEPENRWFSAGTTTGDFNFHHFTSAGCDSILTLHLTVNPSYNESITVRICENDLPYTWRDTIFEEGTISNTYHFSRTSQFGCDSTVTLSLFVYQQPSVTIHGNSNIMLGDTTTLLAQGSSNCSYLWDDGTTTPSITVWPDTTTTYQVTVTNNSSGCSNQASIIVVVDTSTNIQHYSDLPHLVNAYPNPAENQITVHAGEQIISEIGIFDMSGRLVLSERMNATERTIDLSKLRAGTYVLQCRLQSGELVRKKLIIK